MKQKQLNKIMHKTLKIKQHELHCKIKVISGSPERYADPAFSVPHVILRMVNTNAVTSFV